MYGLRAVICRVLRVIPNENHRGSDFELRREARELMYGCEWFEVYDIIEALHARFEKNDSDEYRRDDAKRFAEAMNAFFIDEGIGWQLIDGQIVTRGTEACEAVVTGVTAALEAAACPTAAKHLHEALQDLSRRPEADLPGAVYHAMGSLECVARDLTGDNKATLGEALKRYPGLLPKPLDTALSQIWGYASNEARHAEEGREPSRDEAELLVGLAAALSTYLTRKQP